MNVYSAQHILDGIEEAGSNIRVAIECLEQSASIFNAVEDARHASDAFKDNLGLLHVLQRDLTHRQLEWQTVFNSRRSDHG